MLLHGTDSWLRSRHYSPSRFRWVMLPRASRWPDASPDPNIGYKLHYGTTSGNPSQTEDVGKTTSATVSNLNDGTTYFFTVTAYNAAGESQPSNQVSYTTSAPPSVMSHKQDCISLRAWPPMRDRVFQGCAWAPQSSDRVWD